MNNLWIIVPTYNEAENLPIVVAGIQRAVARCRPVVDATILVVDGSSPDGTGVLADDLARSHTEVVVLHRAAKTGLAGAYREGFRRALDGGADLVVQMDADRSHNPADIPRLVTAARGGADVVVGSRYVKGGGTAGWSAGRRLLSRGGGRYAAAVLGLAVNDPTGGFKCLTARALRAIDPDSITSHGYAFQIETTYRAARVHLPIVEIPIVFAERRAGHSKMSAGIALEALWRVPLLRLAAAAPAVTPRVGTVPLDA